MLTLYRTPLTDAQATADDAFDRLRAKLIASGAPTNSLEVGFPRWAAMARRVAPRELAEFVDACSTVKTLMAAAS